MLIFDGQDKRSGGETLEYFVKKKRVLFECTQNLINTGDGRPFADT